MPAKAGMGRPMALAESYVAGPAAPAARDITLGQLLEQAARSAPERIALIAGVPDPTLRRQWTYSELYAEAQRTARALLSRFKRGLGAEPARMDHA